MRPTPEAKRRAIVKALLKNPNAAGVAREIGAVSKGTVRNIAKAMNIDLGRSGPKKVSPEQYVLITRMLKAHPNASAIAREVGGISYNLVARIAAKEKIELGLAAQKAAAVKARPTTPQEA